MAYTYNKLYVRFFLTIAVGSNVLLLLCLIRFKSVIVVIRVISRVQTGMTVFSIHRDSEIALVLFPFQYGISLNEPVMTIIKSYI